MCVTAMHVFVGALSRATVPVCSIKSKVPFSFEHIIITLIPHPPGKCLIVSMFIAGRGGGEAGYGKS